MIDDANGGVRVGITVKICRQKIEFSSDVNIWAGMVNTPEKDVDFGKIDGVSR